MSASDTISKGSASKGSAERLLASLMRQCSRREYCISDIRQKIRRSSAEVDEQAIIDKLVQEGFLDESRYARAYAREKLLISGWGPAKVRHFLKMKGIPDALVSYALSEVPDNRLDEVVQRKWREISGKYPSEPRASRVARLLRFAMGRGFGYDAVMDSLRRNDL